MNFVSATIFPILHEIQGKRNNFSLLFLRNKNKNYGLYVRQTILPQLARRRKLSINVFRDQGLSIVLKFLSPGAIQHVRDLQ